MKKTLITLTVTALFSSAVLASTAPKYVTTQMLEKEIKASVASGDISVESAGENGNSVYIVTKDNELYYAEKTKDGFRINYSTDENASSKIDVTVHNDNITEVDFHDGQGKQDASIKDGEANEVIVEGGNSAQDKANNNSNRIKDIEESASIAAGELNKIASGAYNDAVIAYSTLDDKVNNNTARIDGLEQDMAKMGNKMLDLEDRMDGVVATSHAVTNARPMVQDAGEFAMGVGIGAAGSKQALALGGAYQFNANWSSSMTVNYETAGKRSNSQVSAGAGVQYRFK
ncbi:hypothetical protein VSAK1_15042 [Vibrio mediterranei AK1]|uniref:YadA C-terminal domain-containing protein n=1 Tax=Vibrio mediterranei TaxID=689 RepID=UPI000154179B|nr:YadA C-terminal domain-containing protein [Vibrio mediterranei]EDL52933.1 hypothetical protein VSAK1_15042 [Vibrio mediterranei AK1]